MRFISEKATLVSALAAGREVSAQKTTLPIIQHLKLDLSNGLLTISATDLDMSLDTTISVDGQEDGVALLPAHQLHEIVKAFPDGSQVEISSSSGDDGLFTIRGGRSRYRLPSLPAQDWMATIQRKEGETFVLDEPSWRRLFATPAPFMDDVRDYLKGEYLHYDGKSLNCAATNSHILCRVEMNPPPGCENMLSVIIPKEAVQRLLHLASGEITLTVSEGQIGFYWDDTVFVSKLIDAAYPDYVRIIPTNLPIKVEADGAEIKAVTTRIAIVSELTKERSKVVKLSFGKESAIISSSGSNGQEGEEEIIVTSSEPITISCAAQYLAIAMSACNGEIIEMGMTDSYAPFVIRPTNDQKLTVVLVPIRI